MQMEQELTCGPEGLAGLKDGGTVGIRGRRQASRARAGGLKPRQVGEQEQLVWRAPGITGTEGEGRRTAGRTRADLQSFPGKAAFLL